MSRRPSSFRFPLDDHSVDSGLAVFDHGASSIAVASTLGRRRSSKKASWAEFQARQKCERKRERLVTLGLTLIAVAAAVLIFFLRQ